VLAYSAAPIALALVLYWPVRIAVYGADVFRTGGPDGGQAGTILTWLFYGFVAWAVALLLVGVRTVHGWSWARSAAGVGLAAVITLALALVAGVLYALG
jgi:hypothetical protein